MKAKLGIFLDTNILIDYFEMRDRKVVTFICNLIEDENIEIITSIYNFVELIDKLQQIKHMGKLVLKKHSYDEIARSKIKDLTYDEREEITEDINKFIQENISIEILSGDGYLTALDIISDFNIESQDALIITAYLNSEAEIFLTKDENLLKEIRKEISHCYHIKKDVKKIKAFIVQQIKRNSKPKTKKK